MYNQIGKLYRRGERPKKALQQPQEHVSTLIKNFGMQLKIFVKRNEYQEEHYKKPRIWIMGQMNDLNIKFSPYTYCHFINITKLVFKGNTMSSNTNSSMRLTKLLDKAAFSGHCQKQGTTIKYLVDYFVVVSAGALYFFPNVDGMLDVTACVENQEAVSPEMLDEIDVKDCTASEWYSIKGCNKIKRLNKNMI